MPGPDCGDHPDTAPHGPCEARPGHYFAFLPKNQVLIGVLRRWRTLPACITVLAATARW